MKIAIFPGHVGKDPGAIDKVNEHELDDLMSIEAVINGQVAVLLKNTLDIIGIDCEIYAGSIANRLINSRGASLGISLHCDSSVESNA
jgi:N-acetylmuramoyl-L-alanine amidase